MRSNTRYNIYLYTICMYNHIAINWNIFARILGTHLLALLKVIALRLYISINPSR